MTVDEMFEHYEETGDVEYDVWEGDEWLATIKITRDAVDFEVTTYDKELSSIKENIDNYRICRY